MQCLHHAFVSVVTYRVEEWLGDRHWGFFSSPSFPLSPFSFFLSLSLPLTAEEAVTLVCLLLWRVWRGSTMCPS